MAVIMRMQWQGVGPELYEQARENVRWDEEPAEGGIIHLAWFDGDTMHVRDLWESAEHFQAFVEQRLMPGVAPLGIETEPEVEILPAYYTQIEDVTSDRASAIVTDGPLGMPPEAYDALAVAVDWKSVPPVDGICHLVAQAPDGSLIHTTAWLNEAAHDKFDSDRVGPAAAELFGDAPPPEAGEAHALHALWSRDA
jgi:hypothetical protein